MRYIFYFFLVSIFVSSCTNPKKLTYFQDIPDTIVNYNISDTGYKELIIKTDDLLQINVSSPNPEATSFFNTQGSTITNGQTNSTSTPNTYLVDKNGSIDLPLVGKLVVRGLSTVKVKEAVISKVKVFLKDPIVTVRLQNFKVTVLGEVNRPANYIVPNERVSVLDVLGMAGDLTIYGKRENVLVIREFEGRKVITRLNLNSSKLFQSSYYYLQQNDIVYVEPIKARAASTDLAQFRNLSLLASLLSVAVLIFTRL